MPEINEKTFGENRIRVDFNPSANSHVEQIKQKTAELINLVQMTSVPGSTANPDEGNEVRRLKSLAQTAYEEAAMWAVKAATAK